MPLQPSEQLLKDGREIYLCGALGIALRIFPIKVQKLPGLDVSLGDSSGAVDLAGLLGVIVGFRLVTFISRTIEEVSRSRVGILELTRDELRRAPTLTWRPGDWFGLGQIGSYRPWNSGFPLSLEPSPWWCF